MRNGSRYRTMTVIYPNGTKPYRRTRLLYRAGFSGRCTRRKTADSLYETCEWTAVALLSSLSVLSRGRAVDMPDFRSNLMKDKFVNL